MDTFLDFQKIVKYRQEANKISPQEIKIHVSREGIHTIRGDFEKIYQYLKNPKSVLDFGVGRKDLENYLKDKGFHGEYYSLDISNEYDYDYSSIEELDRKFDVIVAMEVLEHISLENGFTLLKIFFSSVTFRKVCSLLKPQRTLRRRRGHRDNLFSALSAPPLRPLRLEKAT